MGSIASRRACSKATGLPAHSASPQRRISLSWLAADRKHPPQVLKLCNPQNSMATPLRSARMQASSQGVGYGAALASRPSVTAVPMCCYGLYGVTGTKLPVSGCGARTVRRRRSSFSVTASAELVAQESVNIPTVITKLSQFCLFGKAPVEIRVDQATNAELHAVNEGDSFKWFKSRMTRDVLVAVLFIFGVLFGNATASATAEHSIGSSSLGLKVASFLRRSGLCDEAIVVAIASLPALELRGAIPVGYWMKLPPLKTYALAVIGNMLPVPFIALYLEKFFNYVASSSEGGKKLVDKIITNTRRKAEPIEEFKWIGLILFVAVPFPGTGAWTGAFAASILGMTFWESMSANFVGVLLAGVLVNLVVSVGVREAIFVGIALFLLSMFMWRILRFFSPKKVSDS